jgi:acyl-CoA dehydrogenase
LSSEDAEEKMSEPATSAQGSTVLGLSEDQQTIRAEARALARSFPLEYWRECDRDAAYPWDFVRTFADKGWLSIVVPEEYGGMGLGLVEAGLMLHEVAASGAGMTGASALHFYIFPPAPILRHGSEEMKQQNLPLIAEGKLLMAFGVTEPTAGMDTSRITTVAKRQGDGWMINGQKVWITNAKNAKKILLLTRTSPRTDEHPLDGMTLFFVDLDPAYCEIKEIDKLGRAAVDSNELFITDLPASDEDIVGEVGKGFYHLLDGLNPERIMIGMEATGIGRAAIDMGVKYANERVVFGRPIGTNQALAHPLAAAWAQVEAAELMSLRAAALYDAGLPCGEAANTAKYLGAAAGDAAADAAMQTHGGMAYAKEYHIERLWREVRLLRLAPVSQEMILNFLATKALGLPKSY